MSQSSSLTPTEQQRLEFGRWLVATGDVDEGDAERDAFCVRCRRPLALTPVQYTLVAQGLPIVHRCGQPQLVGGGVA